MIQEHPNHAWRRQHSVLLAVVAAIVAIANPLWHQMASAQEACCFPDGSCTEVMPADCTAAGGTDRGAGTICDDVICPFSDHCSAPAVAIPDNNPAGVDDTIVVGNSETIFVLNVYVRVTHTFVGDVIMTLEHVDTGTTVTLYDRPGVPATTFGCGGNDIEIILADDAVLPIEDECDGGVPTMFGDFTPNEALSAFSGEDMAGTWTLNVSDNASADTGTLEEWCLVFLFDTDGDGAYDNEDACPNDPDKIDSPGICGCGSADVDSDGDGVPDCFDGCPDDPNKLQAGLCGCGSPDVDSDVDGWLDCFDNCPDQANSLQEDADGDGVGNACEPEPATAPIACGAGVLPVLPMMVLGLCWAKCCERRRR
jgi:subtilisin-like proprotein convertase family protein